MPLEAILTIGVIGGGLTIWIAYLVKRGNQAHKVYQQLQVGDPLFSARGHAARCQSMGIAGDETNRTKWRSSVFALTAEQIIYYPVALQMDTSYTFPTEGLRWFGRPVKYHSGDNEIWLHFEADGHWHLLKMTLSRYHMADLVRALKTVAAPELVKAYRRRRPYVHYGPVTTQPATQDIYGAWMLIAPVQVYVTPLDVMVFQKDGKVIRRLPLTKIQQVAALRRIDQPDADGLARFEIKGETLAFSTEQYEALAEAIAQAAKRSLEEPIMRKQKKKDNGDDDDWE
jgi:hypothetical protein